MVDLYIKKQDETYIILESEQSLLYEISELFTFYADGYRYNPKYKAKLWDGKIRSLRLLSKNRGRIYGGLLSNIISFCKSRDYSYKIDDELIYKNEISEEDITGFITEQKLMAHGKKIEARDYQIKTVLDSINKHKVVILSATSSGKSLSLYLLARYFQEKGLKGVLVVPNVSLIHQMFNDFKDYSSGISWNVEDNVHKIYQDQIHEALKDITISTYQSLHLIKDNNFFKQFDYVLWDECFSGDAKVLTKSGYKRIDEISVGDIVINYNEQTKTFKEDVVEKVHLNISVHEKMFELEFDNGIKIKVTGNHKFLTTNGWIRADQLTENDEIISYE
jgi:hypothetical protein